MRARRRRTPRRSMQLEPHLAILPVLHKPPWIALPPLGHAVVLPGALDQTPAAAAAQPPLQLGAQPPVWAVP